MNSSVRCERSSKGKHSCSAVQILRKRLDIDWTAQERVDTMLPHMMEAAGVTEELKACDPMRWVGLMNTLTAQIEEILIRELICS